MPRIRTIKPEFFKHEHLYEAELQYGLPLRLAFIGLWTCCDREGRFRWRPRQLKLDILAYDEAIDFAKVLHALLATKFIVQYEIDGELYGQIPSWHKHQRINNKETVSDIPAQDKVCLNPSEAVVDSPPQSNLNRDEDSVDSCLNPTQGERKRKGKEGEEEMEGNREREKERKGTKIHQASAEFSEILIKIPLKNQQYHVITEQSLQHWQQLFPHLNVLQELRHIASWNEANPLKRKTLQGIDKHINGWLIRTQQLQKSDLTTQNQTATQQWLQEQDDDC